MAGSPQMEEYMRNFNMNPDEVNKQLEDLGVSQEEIVAKMLGDQELREVRSPPPRHVCACSVTEEEPGVTQEEALCLQWHPTGTRGRPGETGSTKLAGV